MRETRVGAPVGHQPSANPHVVIPVQLEPAVLPSYTIPPSVIHRTQFLAWRRARFRRRNFFLRHFHRWLPVFFHAREPRFMVNVPATCRHYMSASDRATSPPEHPKALRQAEAWKARQKAGLRGFKRRCGHGPTPQGRASQACRGRQLRGGNLHRWARQVARPRSRCGLRCFRSAILSLIHI